MAKRKKLEFPPSVIKFFVVLTLAFLLGLGVTRAIENLLTQSSFFRIKAAVIDASLKFIDPRDLVRLTGRNIFTVDLKDVERQLRDSADGAAGDRGSKRSPTSPAGKRGRPRRG